MKKSLLALAVLGVFAGAASAQSSVTIYGVMDLGLVKGNGGSATNINGNGASKAWLERARTNSRLGFKGTEDLGNGLSAEFLIEHRLNPDTGDVGTGAAATTVFWFGRSYVQLGSATMGKIYLGRDYSPAYWTAFNTDPSGWDGVGSLKTNQYAGFLATNGQGPQNRTDNTVGYRSPSFNGFTVDAAVSLGEGSTTVVAGVTPGRDSAINAQYKAGPIYGAVAYEKIKGGTLDGNSLFNIGGSYDFGVVKPMLYYARAKVATLTNKSFSIAAAAPLGQGEAYVAYGRFDPSGANNNQTKIGLGYKHPLSKRTNLYADVGQGKQDGGATNNTAYDFGVKHTF